MDGHVRLLELPIEVTLQIEAQRVAERALHGGLGHRPLPHGLLGVEEIDRHLDEHGARHATERDVHRALHGGTEALEGRDARRPLRDGREDRELIDVLERAAPAQHGGRGAAEEEHRRLGHLRVLDRGDRVGDAGARGHGSDAHVAGEARGGVGREDGVDLLAHVDDV